MKKKLVYLCMLSLLSMLLFSGCGNKEEKNNPYYNSKNYLSGFQYAVIDVQNYGEIFLELYADVAPATVTNFINLAEEGFYDGLTFHRIIDGFMIQGGDPAGDGTGKATYTIPGEFSMNGYENTLNHVRGTISMARAEDFNSGSSQFFIVQQDALELDGYYAAFGQVISGMDVVDSICASTKVEDDNGTVLTDNQPIINSIYVLDMEDIVVNDEQNTTNKPEEEVLPDPTAVISLIKASSTANAPAADNWIVNEDGLNYFLFSSEDLLSIAIYEIDLTNGIEYDKDNPLAYSSNLTANSILSVKITVPENELSLILVAEEHNGALGQYLIGYDQINQEAYLIPIL